MNYYMMETMAREIREDRIREAERDNRWAEIRRAMRQIVKVPAVVVKRNEECAQESELGAAA
jgi:hypothetical protein